MAAYTAFVSAAEVHWLRLPRTECISQAISQSMLGLPGEAMREVLKSKGIMPWRGLRDMAPDGKHGANTAL